MSQPCLGLSEMHLWMLSRTFHVKRKAMASRVVQSIDMRIWNLCLSRRWHREDSPKVISTSLMLLQQMSTYVENRSGNHILTKSVSKTSIRIQRFWREQKLLTNLNGSFKKVNAKSTIDWRCITATSTSLTTNCRQSVRISALRAWKSFMAVMTNRSTITTLHRPVQQPTWTKSKPLTRSRSCSEVTRPVVLYLWINKSLVTIQCTCSQMDSI